MISDYRILGVEEGADLPSIKSAFRKRAKELHPDLSTIENAMPRHDLFVQVCMAYRRLIDGRSSDQKKESGASPAAASGKGVVRHSDQAYVFYRQGMKFYMSIHPSRWNIDTSRMLNTRIAGQDGEEQEAIKRKVMELVKLFPKAYYYFSIVVHEYPDSEWACDAGEKMGKIEERIRMYRKIIGSFTSWNKDKTEMIKEYNETYSRMNENLKAVRGDMPEDWR
jgi:hypothetical protein